MTGEDHATRSKGGSAHWIGGWVRYSYARLPGALWTLILIALPVTSFPLLAKLGGSPIVSPASALPLAFILLVWFGPYLYRRGTLPTELSPLVFFLLVAVFSSGVALYLDIAPYKNQTPLDREIRALVTLLIGVAFYAVATVFIRSRDEMVRTIKLINVGGAIVLIWALAQGAIIYFYGGDYPGSMVTLHRWLSLRDPLTTRVTGLAYEPSWLANMLNLIYFPLWLGMLASWRTVYSRKVWLVPIEFLLLLGGIVVIFLSLSRIGLVGLLSMVGFLAVALAVRLAKAAYRAFWRASRSGPCRPGPVAQGITYLAAFVLVVAMFLLLASTAVYTATQLDWRLGNLADGSVLESIKDDFGYIFSYQFSRALKFSERTAYWSAALEVFNKNVFFGVGLGNSGFFFLEEIPGFGWSKPEVVQAIRPDNLGFPNPKSLWIRILAETGIAGFTFIVVWLSLVLLRAWQLSTQRDPLYKAMGTIGVLALITVVIEGFSLDSFALPYMWISLGLVSAAARLSSSGVGLDLPSS